MKIYAVFLIALCNVTGLRASRVMVSLYALNLGATQFAIGFLIAAYSIFPMLLARNAGRLSDRGTRLPMLVGSLGLVTGLLLPFAFPALPVLYVSAALIGIGFAFFQIAVQNRVGSLGSAEERTRNFSNYSLILALGGLIGPLTAGLLIDHSGFRVAYLAFAVLALVPLFAFVAFPRAEGRGRRRAKKDGAEKAENLLSDGTLRRVLMTSGLVLTGTDLFQFYVPIYGHSIGMSASAIGVVLAMFAAAAFVVRLWMPALVKRWGEQRVLAVALFVSAGTYLLFPLFSNAVFLALIAFVLGLGLGCGQPLSLMLTYGYSPEGRSGEALGLRLTINSFTKIAVPIVFGSIGGAFGTISVFWANSLMLSGGGMLSRSLKRT